MSTSFKTSDTRRDTARGVRATSALGVLLAPALASGVGSSLQGKNEHTCVAYGNARLDVRGSFDQGPTTRLGHSHGLRRGAFALDGRASASKVVAKFWMFGI